MKEKKRKMITTVSVVVLILAMVLPMVASVVSLF